MNLAWFVEEACDLAGIKHSDWPELPRWKQVRIIQNWQTQIGTKTDFVKRANFSKEEKMEVVNATKQEITYDDFAKLDIRVGTIISAELIPKSKKLVKLSVSFGALGTRTILAGIAESYNPDTLNGLQIVAILNLTPRTMMGVESHGMLLAGKDATGQLRLINPNGVAEGGEIG